MSHDTSRRRRRMPTAQTAPVEDLPAIAAVHRLLVRLAIRRIMKRKETTCFAKQKDRPK